MSERDREECAARERRMEVHRRYHAAGPRCPVCGSVGWDWLCDGCAQAMGVPESQR